MTSASRRASKGRSRATPSDARWADDAFHVDMEYEYANADDPQVYERTPRHERDGARGELRVASRSCASWGRSAGRARLRVLLLLSEDSREQTRIAY